MLSTTETEALGHFLADRIEGFGSIEQIRKFATGQSNPTYLITTKSKRYVLRTKPDGQLLKSAHQVDREFRVMSALKGSGVPVPHCTFLSEDGGPIGKSFFVMEYVEGRIFWDPALPDQTRSDRGAIYDNICRAIATLHDVDVASVGLADFGAPGNFFERQLGRWTKQYHATELIRIDDAHWLADWLSDNLVADDGALSIVHGDYRIDNMIFDKATPKPLAILDWELSTLGHPMADIAYQCMQWRQPNKGKSLGLAGVDLHALGIPDEQEYLNRYCELRGISVPDNWVFYLVFSYFRMVAILTGVVRRAAEGNASNPDGVEGYRRAIPHLAKQARDIACGRA